MRLPAMLVGVLLASCTSAADHETETALQAVRDTSVEPDQVKFRDVWRNPNNKVVCGEVNEKNRAGGFNGFVDFYVAEGTAFIDDVAAPIQERAKFAKFMGEVCGDRPAG